MNKLCFSIAIWIYNFFYGKRKERRTFQYKTMTQTKEIIHKSTVNVTSTDEERSEKK